MLSDRHKAFKQTLESLTKEELVDYAFFTTSAVGTSLSACVLVAMLQCKLCDEEPEFAEARKLVEKINKQLHSREAEKN